jgi:Putative beta-barrel porin-2, OmpL-like. bbp2
VTSNTGCDPDSKRTVVGALITIKPTANDTLIIEPYYGNESNASITRVLAGQNPNARWNAILAYYTHDFNDQSKPHAFSARVRGELFEDADGARTCIGGGNFNGGSNTCALGFLGGFAAAPGGGFNGNTGTGLVQTLQSYTFTLQYKPAPSLMTRVEFRHDISNKDAFLYGQRGVDNQSTLGFSAVYLF